MFKYSGKSVEIKYDTGFHYRMEYLSDSQLKWTNLAQGIAGAPESAVESFAWFELSESSYMLNWVEAGGVSVSQVVNYETHEVFAFLTWEDAEARGKRASLAQKGRFEFVEA